ncbi:MAG: 3,4-dihydroxy-2-butanone-4-phosphate synthase [Alphaproteobacteria bacterium]|nr:MAG: 3,4-dihydroxy-2-butanone-4-phosphate synthase [Alphaproteobacteria bacterium]
MNKPKANLHVVKSDEPAIRLHSIDEILTDLKRGKMVVIVDDEDRENEGDLIIPAQTITPEAINFMTKFGRGLICLPITSGRVRDLGLPMMPKHNVGEDSTAFTVSIEAREGVTTGISSADRAHTIQVACDPAKCRDDIVTPGHIFPLVAKDGGVLVRAGHTEATVDLARLAGFHPAGVLCEILNDDGSMARLPDLVGFAAQHDLKLGSIADLISYRLRTESLVERLNKNKIVSLYGGEFELITYRNKISNAEHYVLQKGDITKAQAQGESVHVRVHRFDVFDDLFGSLNEGRGGLLQTAMQKISDVGCGALVLLRDQDYMLGPHTPHQNSAQTLRTYGIGAQIIKDLGIKKMTLLTNHPKSLKALEGYDIEITDQIPIETGQA